MAAVETSAKPDAIVLIALVELPSLHDLQKVGTRAADGATSFGDSAAAVLLSSEESGIALIGGGQTLLPATQDALTLSVGEHGFRFAESESAADEIRRHFIKGGYIQVVVRSEVLPAGEDDGRLLRYTVDPGPHFEVLFEGVSKKESEVLRSILDEIWAASLFGEDLYIDAGDAIREYFQENGHYTVDAQHEVESGDAGRRLEAELAAQARAFVAEGWATDLNELLAEALRRFLESHEGSLTESFVREDVQWGLHGRD